MQEKGRGEVAFLPAEGEEGTLHLRHYRLERRREALEERRSTSPFTRGVIFSMHREESITEEGLRLHNVSPRETVRDEVISFKRNQGEEERETAYLHGEAQRTPVHWGEKFKGGGERPSHDRKGSLPC